MLLIFAVWWVVSSWVAAPLTHITGNRFDLVMMGTPLGTSDHCFVTCVLQVEQSVPERNVRSTDFLKCFTNWDNVCHAVRNFTWNTILKSADPLDAFY